MTLIIDDSTDMEQFAKDNDGRCGCKPRDTYEGQVLACAPSDDEYLIPWEEIPDRIADQKRTKTSLKDIWLGSQIGNLNQQSTNYCWAFAAVIALMVERAVEGKPFVRLSPSSVAGPITGYRNVGGYIEDSLKRLIEHGVASEDYVPQTTLSRNDYKVGWQTNASMHKVDGWDDVGRHKQRQITKILTYKPLVCAFNRMGHAMCGINWTDDNTGLRFDNPNRYGLEPLNSWGKGIDMHLKQSQALADNCYAITRANFAGVV